MSLYKSKSRGLHDLYGFYPHRKNPEFSNTIPVPYIKKEEVSNHKYSMTYAEWYVIIEDIVLSIRDRLQQGMVWKLGQRLGDIEIVRLRCKTFLDRIASGKSGKQVKRTRNDYDNQMVLVEWRRTNEALRTKWLWRFRLVPEVLRDVYLKCDEDYTYIYKFREK